MGENLRHSFQSLTTTRLPVYLLAIMVPKKSGRGVSMTQDVSKCNHERVKVGLIPPGKLMLQSFA